MGITGDTYKLATVQQEGVGPAGRDDERNHAEADEHARPDPGLPPVIGLIVTVPKGVLATPAMMNIISGNITDAINMVLRFELPVAAPGGGDLQLPLTASMSPDYAPEVGGDIHLLLLGSHGQTIMNDTPTDSTPFFLASTVE